MKPELAPQHERLINRLIAHFKDDPRFPALLIAGSVARGRARPDSDVDIILIATRAEFAARHEAHSLTYYNPDLADYPGGYADGKIVDLPFLEAAADHGSEPTRASFLDAFLGYSRLPGLEEVLARIPVYQLHEQPEKFRSFFTQLVVSRWYVEDAARREHRYLLTYFAANLALFAGRLILAHNRILYPYHKWWLADLARAPQQPPHLLEQIDTLLREQTPAAANAVYNSVHAFRDWGLDEAGAFRRWTEENEWHWRTGRPAVADL